MPLRTLFQLLPKIGAGIIGQQAMDIPEVAQPTIQFAIGKKMCGAV
ncbi:MAG: hypothetical protein RLZZ104_436, partial [Pseudomonadota bacterium]